MTAKPAISFSVLGAVEAMRDGQRISLGRPQRRALLALLLLRANRVLTVEEIVTQLWGDRPPATARAQVHALVSALRQALPDGEQILSTGSGGYRLEADQAQLDLLTFGDRVAEARAAAEAGAPAAAITGYRNALALWHGMPLGDVSAAFVERARRGLENTRLEAQEELFDLELALGRHADLVAELTPLVEAHPRRERLRGQLMLALHQDGRSAEAVQVYRDGRAAARGVTSAKLDLLARRILRGEDVTGRQGVPAGAARLPGVPARFTGRAAELAELDRFLSDVDAPVRMVAVCGPEGVGKTTLVTRWAHAAADRFADGVLYADLRGSAGDGAAPADPAAVLADFLAALGVDGGKLPADVAQRAAMFRSAMHGRRSLIVLDDARDTVQVRQLLPGTGTCAVIVTSRDALGGLVARHGARRMLLAEPVPVGPR